MNNSPSTSSSYEKTVATVCGGFKNQPEWDASAPSVIKDYIQSYHDNKRARKMLAEQQIEHEESRKTSFNDLNKILTKQLQFKELFIQYNIPLHVNKDKKKRYYEKAEAEQIVHARLDKEITKSKIKIELLNKIEQDMIDGIAEQKKYVDFLEKVCALAPDDFAEGVHKIPERFELLIKIREDLAKKGMQVLEKNLKLRDKAYHATNEHSQKLIDFQTELSKLRYRYYIAKRKHLKLTTTVNAVEEKTVKAAKNFKNAKLEIWNLYSLICKNNNLPETFKQRETVKQLQFIEETITILKKVKANKSVVKVSKNRILKYEQAIFLNETE